MRKQRAYNSRRRFLGVAAAIVVLFGCSQKLTNDDTAPAISLSMKFTEPGLVQLVQGFHLTVTGPGMEQIDTALILEGRYIVGSVEVPAGRDRKFELSAVDESGRVIYRGDTTVDVEPDAVIALSINLYPAPDVALVKLSPRFLQVPAVSACTLEVKVFNMDSLYSISFRIDYSDKSYLVSPSGAAPGSSLDTRVIFFNQIDDAAQVYAFAVSQVDQATPIVGGDGSATLASVFFTIGGTEVAADSAALTLQVTEAYKISGAVPVPVPLSSIYTDGSLIEIQRSYGPIADVIVPLRVGNYWVYTTVDSLGSSLGTQKLGIPGSTIIAYENNNYQVYFWNWFDDQNQPSDDYYLMRNANNGMWIMGWVESAFDSTVIYPSLLAKYPAFVGDRWEYFDKGNRYSMQCISTGQTIEAPAGTFDCYVYFIEGNVRGSGSDGSHILLSSPLVGFLDRTAPPSSLADSVFSAYVYFAPGVGYVGTGGTADGQNTAGMFLSDFRLE